MPDSELVNLTNNATPASTLLVYLTDGSGTLDYKATLANLAASAAFSDLYVADTGGQTIAGVKTFSSDPLIPDEVYGAPWNTSLEPPTKNAVYDKVESLAQLEAGDGTTVDTSNPGFVSIDVTSDVVRDGDDGLLNSAKLAGGAVLTGVRVATIAALPACTYANGTAGVGATLTADAFGVLADIDYLTPVAGVKILVKNQAAGLQNGLYTVTTLGTAGAAFVLTRLAVADQAADFDKTIVVYVSEGRTFQGSTFVSTPLTVTLGTTAIRWATVNRANATPADVAFGPNRDRRRWLCDFEEQEAAIVVASGAIQRYPGTTWTVYMVGTLSTATQVGAADATYGVIALATGSTTTGYCAVAASLIGSTFQAASPFRYYARVKTPTITSAAELFTVRAGAVSDFSSTTPTTGIYFEAQNDGGNWDAVCCNASTETRVDTGSAQTTGYKGLAIFYDPDTLAATFYIGTALVATISTNMPASTVGVGAAILKQGGTVGTTSRLFHVDMISVDIVTAVALSPLIP